MDGRDEILLENENLLCQAGRAEDVRKESKLSDWLKRSCSIIV